ILWRPHRLFEPEQIVLANLVRDRKRFGNRPRTVGIHHELDVRADGFACRFDLRRADFMQLDRAVAALDCPLRIARDKRWIAIAHEARISIELTTPRTAKQVRERLAGGLA